MSKLMELKKGLDNGMSLVEVKKVVESLVMEELGVSDKRLLELKGGEILRLVRSEYSGRECVFVEYDKDFRNMVVVRFKLKGKKWEGKEVVRSFLFSSVEFVK